MSDHRNTACNTSQQSLPTALGLLQASEMSKGPCISFTVLTICLVCLSPTAFHATSCGAHHIADGNGRRCQVGMSGLSDVKSWLSNLAVGHDQSTGLTSEGKSEPVSAVIIVVPDLVVSRLPCPSIL